MKINRRIVYWVCVFLLVGATFYFGFIRQGYRIKVKIAKKAAPVKEIEKPVPVEVEIVSTGSIEETIELTGWIKANKVVDVKSKVQGRIESLQVISDGGGSVDLEEGLAVKKGQQLAVIDHDVYLAQVAAAKASVKTGEVELADAEREKNRIIALYEGGSATEQSRDKAVTAAELAKARLTLANSNLELAQINLRESTIISPIDGIVTAKHIDEGNLIRAGDRIATVADMKTVKVIVAVAEKYGADIAGRNPHDTGRDTPEEFGTPAKIRVDTFAERVFTTRVYSIYPALDAETHMIQVEIRLKNDELLLKPGMFARVTLITERKDDVVVILRDVVLGGRIDDKPYVYVVEDEIGHKRFVKLGINQADKFEITEGLRAGERLVVNGMNYLADGMSVEVVRIEDIK